MVCACTVVSLAHVELEKGAGMSEIVLCIVGCFLEFGFFVVVLLSFLLHSHGQLNSYRAENNFPCLVSERRVN